MINFLQPENYSILIVDDEEDLRLPLQDALIDCGFQVDATASGVKANTLVRENLFDLVILDIELPDIGIHRNGYDLCRQWKQDGVESKVLILTGKHLSEVATVYGFEQGADEYVVKPYSLMVLLARIRAILTRTTPHKMDVYTIPGLTINKQSREVCDDNHNPIGLTPKEYNLLLYLVNNIGTSLSYDDILINVWGTKVVVNQATVNNTVHNIRKKLSIKSKHAFDIVTVHSYGFKFIET